MAKVIRIGDQIVITMNLVEAEAVAGDLLDGNNGTLWLEIVEKTNPTLAARTLSAPVEPGYDPKGQIRCHVDPACVWTGKSLARAKVHADRNTLPQGGHLPKLIKA